MRSGIHTDATSSSCCVTASWRSARSPGRCRSAGRPCRVTSGCSGRPAWSGRGRGRPSSLRARWPRRQGGPRVTSSRSGERRPPDTGWWPRTPHPRRRAKRRNDDRAAPSVLRRRCAPGPRLRHVDASDRSLVAGRPHRHRRAELQVVLEGRVGGRIFERTPDGREMGLGRGGRVGAAGPARVSLAPAARPGRGDRGRDPVRAAGRRSRASISNIEAGRASAPKASRGATGTGAVGRPCCPTMCVPSSTARAKEESA